MIIDTKKQLENLYGKDFSKYNKQLSVLMPCYNAQKYIREAIESILNQTYENFDFIIVDDNSIDNTWEIVQEYANKDTRIKAYKNDINQYIARNRNILLSLAESKYIAWMDSDDISFPHRLENQIIAMEKDKEIGICGGFLEFFGDNNENTSIRLYKEFDKELRNTIFRYSPVAQPSSMVRLEVYGKVGVYNEEYPPAEDLDMSFRIGKFYKFYNLQDTIIRYRINECSATFSNLKKMEVSTLKVRYKNKTFYSYSYFDILYNFAQLLFIFIMPSKLKIRLFNIMRNTKNITKMGII